MLQLELLTEFKVTPEDLRQPDGVRFGQIERDGKPLYRYRAKGYRIYFEVVDAGVRVHRVLQGLQLCQRGIALLATQTGARCVVALCGDRRWQDQELPVRRADHLERQPARQQGADRRVRSPEPKSSSPLKAK